MRKPAVAFEADCLLTIRLPFGMTSAKLVPFAKAYSGLTNEEIREVDRFVKQTHLSDSVLCAL